MRLLAGVVVLVMLLSRVGTGPFVEGIRLTSAWSLLVATAVTAVTTLCCAWRWRLVAARLGTRLEPGRAYAAVYRAQFVNATLPGGILGDVDRAAGQARETESIGVSIRSVVWERTFGQVVQVAISVALLLVLPSPLRPIGIASVAVLGVLTLGVLFATVALGRSGGLAARVSRRARADVVAVLRERTARNGILLGSAGSVVGHLVIFVLAARIAGVSAPLHTLLPLAGLVLLAASVPTNVAGWGPREGVAAWAFGAAGLGVGAGVTTAVVFGVMALVATLPGAAMLLVGRKSRQHMPTQSRRVPVLEGSAHG